MWEIREFGASGPALTVPEKTLLPLSSVALLGVEQEILGMVCWTLVPLMALMSWMALMSAWRAWNESWSDESRDE